MFSLNKHSETMQIIKFVDCSHRFKREWRTQCIMLTKEYWETHIKFHYFNHYANWESYRVKQLFPLIFVRNEVNLDIFSYLVKLLYIQYISLLWTWYYVHWTCKLCINNLWNSQEYLYYFVFAFPLGLKCDSPDSSTETVMGYVNLLYYIYLLYLYYIYL